MSYSLGKLFSRKGFNAILSKRLLSRERIQSLETLAISELEPYVYGVALNRPDNLNALNDLMWREIRIVFDELGKDPKCRSIVLSGNGRIFTAGIDLMGFSQLIPELRAEKDVSAKAKFLYEFIINYQQSISALEKCPKPVIAAIHNACVGAGVDLVSTADIRYCTEDAFFQIKEVDLGIAADVGTLQRFPKIVGNDSLARELCYTARRMKSSEAASLGFVSHIAPDLQSLMERATSVASTIAEKSPVAVQGTKVNILHARDHSVDESLEYQARWNSVMLQSEDTFTAAMANMSKTNPEFNDL